MEEKLKFLIANCCQVDPSQVGSGSGINTTPNWDSFGHMQIMVCIEQEFGLTLDTSAITSLTSYQDILAFLKKETR